MDYTRLYPKQLESVVVCDFDSDKNPVTRRIILGGVSQRKHHE